RRAGLRCVRAPSACPCRAGPRCAFLRRRAWLRPGVFPIPAAPRASILPYVFFFCSCLPRQRKLSVTEVCIFVAAPHPLPWYRLAGKIIEKPQKRRPSMQALVLEEKGVLSLREIDLPL